MKLSLIGFLKSPWFVSTLFIGYSCSAYSNEFYSLNLKLGEETNVSRGLDDFHELGSRFSSIGFNLGKRFQLGLNDAITLSANSTYTRFDELRGFDRFSAGLAASYRYKFGFGPHAPSAGVTLNYGAERSQGAARDFEFAGLELSLEKRFLSGWLLGAGIDYQRNFSDSLPADARVLAFGYDPTIRLPFELFDFSSASLFANADYSFQNGWMLSGSFRKINGATVASTTEPSLSLYKISQAFYSDPAFGSEFARPWFAYQLETNTNQYETGLSIPLLRDTAIDFTASWNDISGPSDRDYDNAIFAVTLLHNF